MSLLAYDLSKQNIKPNVKAPKQVALHSYSGCGGFTCVTQRRDNEHEMVVGTVDGTILVYDLDFAQPTIVLTDRNRVKVTACEVSPDGRHLVTGLADGTLAIYEFGTDNGKATMKLVLQATCHSGSVVRVCWTLDNKQIVSAGNDGELIVWNFFTR